MDSFFGFFAATTAADTMVGKYQNQILFDNFIEQAKQKSILQYKPNTMKGWNGEPFEKLPFGMETASYNILYDVLVDVGII